MTIVSEFLELIRAYDRQTNDNLHLIRKALKDTKYLVADKEVIREHDQIKELAQISGTNCKAANYNRAHDLKFWFIHMTLVEAAKVHFTELVRQHDMSAADSLYQSYTNLEGRYDLDVTIVAESQTASGLLNKYGYVAPSITEVSCGGTDSTVMNPDEA